MKLIREYQAEEDKKERMKNDILMGMEKIVESMNGKENKITKLIKPAKCQHGQKVLHLISTTNN